MCMRIAKCCCGEEKKTKEKRRRNMRNKSTRNSVVNRLHVSEMEIKKREIGSVENMQCYIDVMKMVGIIRRKIKSFFLCILANVNVDETLMAAKCINFHDQNFFHPFVDLSFSSD